MLSREIEIFMYMYLVVLREIFFGILSDFFFSWGYRENFYLLWGNNIFIIEEDFISECFIEMMI